MRNRTAFRARLRQGGIALGVAVGSGGLVLLLVDGFNNPATIVGAALLIGGWTLLGYFEARRGRQTVAEVARLRREIEAFDHRQRDRTRRIESAVETARGKASRHEYVQEQALDRIESRVRQSAAAPEAGRATSGEGRRVDVLFVTSNGAGLGHLTRLLAVATRIRRDLTVEFLTLSRAYRRVAGQGYPIHYFPSAETSSMGSRLWNTVFRRHMHDVVAEALPRVVVFDGTVVYEGLIDVCRGYGIPLIWMQRGCWKSAAEARYPARRNAASVADGVIIPGDYACDESTDVGNGVTVRRVGPIVLTREEDVLPAHVSRAELGLADSSRHILVNLGGWSLPGQDSLAVVLRDITEAVPDSYAITVVSSPLMSEFEMPGSVNVVERYPIAPYGKAFEFVIAAAGYNAVQEAAALRVPTIFVPNDATQTDDQVRRAESAAAQGWASVARTRQEIREAVWKLCADESLLEGMRRELAALRRPTGADEAAEFVESVISDQRWIDLIDRA